LLDCEELFLGYDAEKFDTDDDLFPDGLEFRMGTNGADGKDWKEDLDFDGVISGDEILQGTSPIRADAETHRRNGYRFEVERISSAGAAETCYALRIENVPTTRTQETAEHEPGVNELVVEVIESPEDAAETIFALRRMVVRVEFTRVRPPTLTIDTEDFETVSEQELPPVR
jgi:hypothetical protein